MCGWMYVDRVSASYFVGPLLAPERPGGPTAAHLALPCLLALLCRCAGVCRRMCFLSACLTLHGRAAPLRM